MQIDCVVLYQKMRVETMVKSTVFMHDRNALPPVWEAGGRGPRIHFINYHSLAGIEQPVWGPRRLADFELILSLCGEFEFLHCGTGERVRQRPGEVLLIRPGEPHIYRLDGDPEHAFFSCIHLDPGLPADGPEFLPPRLSAFSSEHAMPELFHRAYRLFHRPGRRSEALLAGVVRLIWLYLLEPPGDVAEDERLKEMVHFLEQHLPEHPTRLVLSRHFHLTPQRINALFKEKLGMSPGEYVHRRLAERGYALLHEEQLSVKETAARLGFSSPFYFSRVFRKVFGMPPSAI